MTATRLCIIGNSHTACLKEAWTGMSPAFPHIEIVFFAASANGLATLELKDGCLESADAEVTSSMRYTSGGMDRIPLAEFDAFLVHGLNFLVPEFLRFLSKAVISQCLDDIFAAAPNIAICSKIRHATGVDVYSGHNPLRAVDQPLMRMLGYERVYAQMSAKLQPQGIRVVQQPAETILQPTGTRIEFSRGSNRLDLGKSSPEQRRHPEHEDRHMNADFGRLFLEQFLARVMYEQRAAMREAAAG